jgi:hypothetical protein
MINNVEFGNNLIRLGENVKGISYNKSTKIFSVKIFDIEFISLYKKNTKIGKILDDFHAFLGDLSLARDDFFLLKMRDLKPVSEKKKIHQLISTNQDKFIIGIKFTFRILTGKIGRPREHQYILPFKTDFKEIFQKLKSDLGIDNKTFESIEIFVNEKRISHEIFFEKIVGNLLEEVISEYGNVFELKIEDSLLSEEKPIISELATEIQRFDRAIPTLAKSKDEELEEELYAYDKRIYEKKEREKTKEEPPSPPKGPSPSPSMAPPPPEAEPMFEEAYKRREAKKDLKRSKPEAGKLLSALRDTTPEKPARLEEIEGEAELESPPIPTPIRYDINMGLQYYSVMMEQCSYLFYVYFSHEELKIEDEEGKVIYETKFTIETIKKEPPILDIKVGGDGFEVHPLIGKIVVNKDAINPPVMIFSVLPLKSDKKKTSKEKKQGEKRFLHLLIDFENKTICHEVLAITVQPKHFHLDLGPIHIDIGKTSATFISIISLSWAIISVVYSIFSIDLSSTLFNIVGGFAPSLVSILFVIIFFYTLIKGVYPLKKMVSSSLNFGKTTPISK